MTQSKEPRDVSPQTSQATEAPQGDAPLLQVRDLKMYFKKGGGFLGAKPSYIKAVDGVSFDIARGETFGLVGESGCGKSTTGLSIIRLHKPTSGQVIYDGHDIAQLSSRELKPYRSRLQMIFQDPYASLNPRMTVMDLIAEPIDIAGTLSGKDRADRVYELLERVGLARDHANRYPHEFSGGQRQRIGIARALASDPEFIVCDEPISALDVSIQAQVVNMLEDLQQQMGLTYLFVAHDLSMVRHISRRVGVMYLGSLVETAESQEIYEHPLHPYSKALMSAIPILDPVRGKAEKPKLLKGEIPSPLDMPPGCRFASRCPLACERCRTELPQLKEAVPGHMVACHLVNE